MRFSLKYFVFILKFGGYYFSGEDWRKGIGEEDMDLPLLDIKTISIATDDFSHINFLGRGGFGPVYKVVYNVFITF